MRFSFRNSVFSFIAATVDIVATLITLYIIAHFVIKYW